MLECGAEEIFAEPVNPRGKGLLHTREALAKRGFVGEAAAIGRISRRVEWSHYATKLLENLQGVLRQAQALHKLRYLLYPSCLTEQDLAWINAHAEGVKKLGSLAAWQGKAPVRSD